MRRFRSFATCLPILLILTACGGTKAVYDQAHTPPQYVKAVLLHHNAVGTQIADLRADPAVSADTKEMLRRDYRMTVCSDAELTADEPTSDCDEGLAYVVEAAGRSAEGLSSATTEAELQKAVDDLVALLVKIIDTIATAK